MDGVRLTVHVVQTLPAECVQQKATALARRAHSLAREHGVASSDRAYALLANNLSGYQTVVSKFINEVFAICGGVFPGFPLAILSLCRQTNNVGIADRLCEHFRGSAKLVRGILHAWPRRTIISYSWFRVKSGACDDASGRAVVTLRDVHHDDSKSRRWEQP